MMDEENCYKCTLDPETSSILRIYLFRDVKNMKELKKKIVSGDLKCSILKPDLILDPFQIAVAANKSVISQLNNSMITKSVYSEILMNLSPSKNITQSLLKFGLDDKKSEIIVAVIEKRDENVSIDDILKQVDGILCPITDLCKYSDKDAIKNVYMENEQNIKDELGYIVGKIVCKDFIDRT